MSKPVSSVFGRGLRAAPTFVALGLGSGCVSAEIPEVVVTRSDVAFVGMPPIPGIAGTSQELSTEFEHPSDFELPQDLNPTLQPLSARVAARGDMSSLAFLEGLRVILSSRAPGAPPPLVVATYERPTGATAIGRVLELDVDPDSDVLSYWDTDQAYYEVTLWGVLPERDWSIDVSFVFSGTLSTN